MASDLETDEVPQGPHSRSTVFLTSDVPGIGGRVRERPEDFLVDEIPAYEPSGGDRGTTGTEHIAMLVQKTGMSTIEMVEVIATHFGVRRMDVGYAGLKDKHAITRQMITVHVPGKKIEDFPMLQHDRIGVLWADYHANKLKPGHLKGNRFSIRIRGVQFSKVREAKAVLDRLERLGVPNRVGEQRFGLLENNHDVGAALIAGDFERVVSLLLGPDPTHPEINAEARLLFASGDLAGAIHAFPRGARAEQTVLRELLRGRGARAAVLAVDRTMLSFYVSALQSAVFNSLLDQRLAAGTLATLESGDLAFKHENGSVFGVDDATAADPGTRERLRTVEISPSGPMWGGGMTRAGGSVLEREEGALASHGVSIEQVEVCAQRSRLSLEGKRRPLRVPLTNTDCEGGLDEHGPYVRVVFDLPRGAFATAVLPEIMKGGGGE
jgi:tRNA pseudouridine13 synthase